MSEIWKKKQIHEDARKMYRVKIPVKTIGKMLKATFGRPRYRKKNGQAGRSSDLVQKVLGLCEAENGTHIDELLQAGASAQKNTAREGAIWEVMTMSEEWTGRERS